MLRLSKPEEAEPRWRLTAAAPSNHHHKRPTMHRDSVFPESSSSLLTSFAGISSKESSSNKVMCEDVMQKFTVTGTAVESRAQGSGIALELERFNSYDGDFFNIISQDCNSLQFESMNQITGQASLTVNPRELAVSELTTGHQNLRADTETQRQHTITAKRYKTVHSDKLQPVPTISPAMKVSTTIVKKSQKLGDKITALQQLVSPFGKTDTASVLQEACAFIKLLHEQIRVLTSPHFGAINSRCFRGNAGETLSLRRNGLCLVPISSTIMNLTDQQIP